MEERIGIKQELIKAASQEVIDYYRRNGLHTTKAVKTLIKRGLREPVIATKKNCNNEDHCSQLSFVSDVLTGKANDFIVWANRAGSKSYIAGMITWIRCTFFKKYETTILGGSLEQSEKSYRAINNFWDYTELGAEYLTNEPMMKLTRWKSGSIASILAASSKSVRGPHPQALLMDEIDEMDKDIYNAALSMPQSKYGYKASIGKLSTNHKSSGVMDIALERAREFDTKIYKWCIWECLEACKDYNCSTCKLSTYCPGKHMKKADGYYLVEDFIQKLHELSDVTLQTEWLCNKVGAEDLIYGAQYDEQAHCALDLPGFDPKKYVVLSVDWGGTNPFSIGVWQKFTNIGWVRVDEVYMSNTHNGLVIKECKKRPWWKKIREGVCDPSSSGNRREWDEHGISLYKADNDVDGGIEATRSALAPVIGNPKFYVNRRCKAWRREVLSYSTNKAGQPVKENDHAMDDTRYFVMRYIKKTREPNVRRFY